MSDSTDGIEAADVMAEMEVELATVKLDLARAVDRHQKRKRK